MFNTVEDVDKLLEVLRKHGVDKFKFEALEVEMGSAPYREGNASPMEGGQVIPEQSALDQMVGMPNQGLDDPFLDYSVIEPEQHED